LALHQTIKKCCQGAAEAFRIGVAAFFCRNAGALAAVLGAWKVSNTQDY
jgi:hypothetical protein